MNRLEGMVRRLRSSGGMILADVEIGSTPVTSVIVGTAEEYPWLKEEETVGVTFKETEVFLAKGLQGELSIRNRFACVVTGVTRGEILTTLTLDFSGRPIGSVITRRAADALALNTGDRVEALVKSTEVSLIKLPGKGETV